MIGNPSDRVAARAPDSRWGGSFFFGEDPDRTCTTSTVRLLWEPPARDAQQLSLRLQAKVVRELKVTIEMSLQISKDR
jgi:hypothetical protein